MSPERIACFENAVPCASRRFIEQADRCSRVLASCVEAGSGFCVRSDSDREDQKSVPWRLAASLYNVAGDAAFDIDIRFCVALTKSTAPCVSAGFRTIVLIALAACTAVSTAT